MTQVNTGTDVIKKTIGKIRKSQGVRQKWNNFSYLDKVYKHSSHSNHMKPKPNLLPKLLSAFTQSKPKQEAHWAKH
jgi:hypothetical protein